MEEQALIDRVSDTQTIDCQRVEEAAQLMLIESRSLEEGEYKLVDIGNMFLDCCDRVQLDQVSAPTAMVAAIDKVAMPALNHKDQCSTHLRVVDPLTDPGI